MTKNVVIVYERFIENDKTLNFLRTKNTKIISLDYYSHKQLESINIEHEIYDLHLSESEMEIIDKTAFDITTNWYKDPKINNEFTIDGISFGWLLEQEIHPSLVILITIFFLLLKIKESESPENIIISNDLLGLANSVFSDCEIHPLKEEKEEKERWRYDIYPVKYNIARIPVTIRMPRKIFFRLRKYYEKYFIPMYNKIFSKEFKNKKSIILVDFNPTLFGEFLDCISQKNVNVFLLNRRRPAIWNFKSFNTVRKTNCKLTSYEQFLGSEDKMQIQKLTYEMNKKIDKLFSEKKLFSNIFSLKGVSFWERYEKYFKNYCKDRFAEAIYEHVGSKKFLSILKPSMILHFYETALQEKVLVHHARNQNIQTVILQHGTPHLSFPGFTKLNSIHGTFPIYSDKKIVYWGNILKNYALENGIKEENIIVSGSPKHDKFFHLKNNLEHKNEEIILVALGQINMLNARTQVTTTYLRYEQSLRMICNSLKKIQNKKKIIKLHPGDMVWRTVIVEPIIHSIDPSIQILVDADLGKLLQSSAIVITLGLTTVLLEANIFEKPTLTLIADHQEFLCASNSGYSELFSSNEGDKFEKYLKDILTDNKITEMNIQKGREFVSSYLANQNTASEYLAKKIVEFVE